MNLKINSKLKRFAGFVSAAIVVFAANYFLHIDFHSPELAFLFLATLFIVDYMHDNIIGYAHMVAIFFWAFNTFMWFKDSAFLFGIILASVAAFIPLAMHLRIKEKNKKPR